MEGNYHTKQKGSYQTCSAHATCEIYAQSEIDKKTLHEIITENLSNSKVVRNRPGVRIESNGESKDNTIIIHLQHS